MFINCQEKYWIWIRYPATKSIKFAPEKIMIWQDIFSREIGNNLENKH